MVLCVMQSAAVSDAEESKDSSSRNLYAAHIVRQGLNKEGWKLVVTGASMTVFVVSKQLLLLMSTISRSVCRLSVARALFTANCAFNSQALCREAWP